jgi:aspartate aminotransferase
MKLSQRMGRVAPSATIAITRRAAQMKAAGTDVVSFGAGEPDFDTPQFIKDAAKAALDAGDTKYTPRAMAALKQAIADKLARENAVHVKADQVIVTFGGKHALYGLFQALVDDGDKVLIPSPYWVSYSEQVRLAGGEPVFLPATVESGFKITPRQVLAGAEDPRAKILVMNSPSNPTSVTYTPEELSAIAQAVLKTNLIVISDEVYEKLLFGGAKFVSFAALDERLPERTITVNALSKPFAMTGWRLGWAAGPKDVISAVSTLMSHETTDPVSFAVAGALAAYTSPEAGPAVEMMRVEFDRRGQHMWKRLNAIPGVTCVQPTGAFYGFPDVSRHYGRRIGNVDVTGSMSFSAAVLETAQVALVPGLPFGEDRCVRLSFATSMQQIDKGIDRLEKLLK